MFLKHVYQGLILPQDKQSKISMIGYYVENSLGRGEKYHDITHTTVFGVVEQETFSIGLQMILLKIGVPQTCFEIALTWSSCEDQTLETRRIHQE